MICLGTVVSSLLLALETEVVLLHWYVPSYVPMFGETECDPTRQFSAVPIEEQLGALGRAVDLDQMCIGLSNETPYGVMKFLQVSKGAPCYPRIVALQNAYSLLCRSFDSGLAECCHHEGEVFGRRIKIQSV